MITDRRGAIAVLAIVALLFCAQAGRAQVKISSLPAASTLAGGELIPAVQGGANVVLTPTGLATFVEGGEIHGTPTAGHCVSWFSASVLQDSGAACGGSGGTTPASGTFTALVASSINDSGLTPSVNVCADGSSNLTSSCANEVAIANLAQVGANTVLGNGTGSTANVTALATTGIGSMVEATSPTLVTPTLGAATATSINGDTLTTGTFTLTGSAAKTLQFDNTLELAGTDFTKMTFPTTSQTIAGLNNNQTFGGQETFLTFLLSGPGQIKIGGVLAWSNSNSAPTCSAVGGSPTCAVTADAGSAAFWLTLGSASSATTVSITGFTATAHAYVCPILMDTTTSTIWGLQTSWSTTGATWTFYTKGTATAASPGASDVITSSCTGT